MTPFETAHHRALILIDSMTDEEDEDDTSDEQFIDLLQSLKTECDIASERATSLLTHDDPRERYFAISLIAQLLNPIEDGQEGQAIHLTDLLVGHYVAENDPACLIALADALGVPYTPGAEATLISLSKSDDEEVRITATASLGLMNGAAVSPAWQRQLLSLSNDPVSQVREWATLWLSEIEDYDEAVREALTTRLWDKDGETRSEAIRGLAIVRDKQAKKELRLVLKNGDGTEIDIESAGLFGDPSLLLLLDDYESPEDDYVLEWAMLRCSRDEQERQSVDDTWTTNQRYLHVKNGYGTTQTVRK